MIGLEPTLPRGNRNLNPARLPISPHPHVYDVFEFTTFPAKRTVVVLDDLVKTAPRAAGNAAWYSAATWRPLRERGAYLPGNSWAAAGLAHRTFDPVCDVNG